MLAVGGFEHAHGTGHTHRATAQHRCVKGQGLAVFTHELRGAGGGWGGFASVKGLHALTVKVHQESATPNATGLGFYQSQHQLHRNRGVQRRAARAQDLQSRIGRQWVGRGHGLAGVRPAGFVGQAAGGFGLLGHAVAPAMARRCHAAGAEQCQRQHTQGQGFFHGASVDVPS